MSIKDKIESLLGLLDDELPTFLPANEPKPLTVADLRALAASHTALLELLKTRGNDYTSAEDGEIWRAKVKAAIEEAEKL